MNIKLESTSGPIEIQAENLTDLIVNAVRNIKHYYHGGWCISINDGPFLFAEDRNLSFYNIKDSDRIQLIELGSAV